MSSASVGIRPVGVVAILIALLSSVGLSPGFSQATPDLESRQDFISAIFSPDADSQSATLGTGRTGTGQPPRFGPNLRANAAQVLPDAGRLGRSETSIAAGEGGQHIVVGFNDAQGFCGPPFNAMPACTPQSPSGLSGYAYSSDGGLTWVDGGAPDPALGPNVFTRGDPWLDHGGGDGRTFYYANLAVHSATGVSLGISVHRGHFRGNRLVWGDVRTFDSPANPGACVSGTPPAPTACDFYDKEAIVVDTTGPDAYVSLTNFQGQPTIDPACGNLAQFGFGQIEVWRTNDGGNTWLGPVIAGPEAPDSVATCGDEGTLQQSSVPAIGPDGEVYVVWQYGPTFAADGSFGTSAQIKVARSLNGGLSFDSPVTVAAINTTRGNPPVGYNRSRINDHPRVAVATTGRHRGRVYVAFYSSVTPAPAAAVGPCPPGTPPPNDACQSQSLVPVQVYVSYSDNRGMTWSDPVPIAPMPAAVVVKRFWPVVMVEAGGDLHVVYYESNEMQATTDPADLECTPNIGAGLTGGRRRAGLASSLVDTYWVQSRNGALAFDPPVRISTATSNWCTAQFGIRPNFGDYIGGVAGGNRFLATWADSRFGPVDTFVTHILGGQSGR